MTKLANKLKQTRARPDLIRFKDEAINKVRKKNYVLEKFYM